LKPEYNILQKAYSSLGFKHSEESRAKISSSKVGENNPRFGKPKPEGAGSSNQKIEVTDLTLNQKTTYDSMSLAALALDIKKSRISMYLKRDQKSPYLGRYIFKKV